MKKSARVSEKLVSPGLPGLQVATRLQMKAFVENIEAKGFKDVKQQRQQKLVFYFLLFWKKKGSGILVSNTG